MEMELMELLPTQLVHKRSLELLEAEREEWHKLDRAFDREEQLMRSMAKLGLSPVSRSKASRETPKAADPFAEFET